LVFITTPAQHYVVCNSAIGISDKISHGRLYKKAPV
jgi:hypothetical protein